jgi:hypothetical protein
MKLLVKDLKAALEGLPDDAPVLLRSDIDFKRYLPLAAVYDFVALVEDNPRVPNTQIWTEDIFGSDNFGEYTKHGVRVKALCLD